MFGVAVNHFWKPSYPASVLQSTKFALSLLKNCPEVTTIVLVDSSETYDADLDGFCRSLEIIYRHSGRTLSFSEAYNFGVSGLGEEWVVTMASDIYVKPGTFTLFKEFIENNPNVPIGCLIPYLSASDYFVQEASQNWPQPTCYCGVMTYNLNVFPRSVFQKLGGLSDKYSGNFNDIDTSLKLQRLGLKIVLVDNFVQHYGRLTLQHGSAAINYQKDCSQFQQDYPSFVGVSSFFPIKMHRVLEHPVLKLISLASGRVKSQNRRKKIELWLFKHIAALQRIKHKSGRTRVP